MRIVFTKEEVADQIAKSAKEISAHYNRSGMKLKPVIVLEGGKFYGSRLLDHLGFPEDDVGYVTVSSYMNGTDQKKPKIEIEKFNPEPGMDILFIDDVGDSWWTVNSVTNFFSEKFDPRSIKTTVLFNKVEGRREKFMDCNPDFSALKIYGKPWLGCCGLDFSFWKNGSRDGEALLALEEKDRNKKWWEKRREAKELLLHSPLSIAV